MLTMQQTSPIETEIAELRKVINTALAGAGVVPNARPRLVAAVEAALRENASVMRTYLRTVTADERAQTMLSMVAEGSSLEEVGREFGLTRERVRQILTNVYGPDYRKVQSPEVRVARDAEKVEMRRREWESKYGDAVRDLFERGYADATIAEAVGTSLTQVVGFRSRHGLRRTRGVEWSDEDIIKALQSAYDASDGNLTMEAYRLWRASGNERIAPSHLTVSLRFGSFPDACDVAGVPCASRKQSKVRSDYITPEEARSTLEDFVKWAASNGLRMTTGNYEKYRAAHGGPSIPIVTRRLGSFRSAVDDIATGA